MLLNFADRCLQHGMVVGFLKCGKFQIFRN